MDGWPRKVAGDCVWAGGAGLVGGFCIDPDGEGASIWPKQPIGYSVLMTFLASCWVDYELSGSDTHKSLALQPDKIIAAEMLENDKFCRFYTDNHVFDLAESCETALIRSALSCKK